MHHLNGFNSKPTIKNFTTTNITLEDIEQARDKCADVVFKFGERYLPIFQRLELEIEKKRNEQSLMAKVRKIATQNATQSATQNGNHTQECIPISNDFNRLAGIAF